MRVSSRRLALLAAALVVFRSLVWVCWEQSHFDSDQATYGLMARHLAEGRAWPIFMYGQTYMLAVESWLAAPLFAVFGSSVAMLKLPILAMNVGVALLLFRGLTRDAGLTPAHAFVASLFFVVVPPITASRLVEAAGGNIEPFVYVLLLWFLRQRPIVFGIVAAVGITHREFTWYAVAALLVLDAWTGVLVGRRLVRWGSSLLAGATTAIALRWLATRGDVLGPGTVGMPTEALIGGAAARLCLDPSASVSNLSWLVDRNLSVLFGWRPEALATFNLASRLTAGHVWVLIPLGLISLLALRGAVGLVLGRSAGHDRGDVRRKTEAPAGALFPAYLALVGVGAALAYALVSCGVQDPMLIRYTLLSVFVPVGAAAWLLAAARSGFTRRATVVAVVVWASAAMWDNGSVLAEYVAHPPPSRIRSLIGYLDQQDIRYGRAPYWTAYVVDFISDERIVLASLGQVRIADYQSRVDSAEDSKVRVTPAPCERAEITQIQGWCIERFAE